jgi:hypothetical protein
VASITAEQILCDQKGRRGKFLFFLHFTGMVGTGHLNCLRDFRFESTKMVYYTSLLPRQDDKYRRPIPLRGWQFVVARFDLPQNIKRLQVVT